MDVQVRTVTTDQCQMDYCQFGRGGQVLVILPGLSVQSVMQSAEAIAEAYHAFTDAYTVYVFDRRKGVLPETYTVHDMAEDTAGAIQALGLESADIFGASQGGMMAMEIAIHHPELVRKMIVGSSSARITEEQCRLFDVWIDLAKAGKAEELYLAFGEKLYPAEVFEGSKELLLESAKTVTEEELARFIILAEGVKGFDISGDLDQITCQVLVIGSKDDRVLGGEASGLIAEGLRNSAGCKLYMYDGYGHAVYDVAPDYRERMLDFLKSSVDP